MADLVVRDGLAFKRRNPWGVFGLTIITLGIYYIYWWYKINEELRDLGQQNDPLVATLAATLGWFILVPPFVTAYKTADRILKAQEAVNASERMIPVLGLVLFAVVNGFHAPYYQSQLNKVYDAMAAQGAEIQPA